MLLIKVIHSLFYMQIPFTVFKPNYLLHIMHDSIATKQTKIVFKFSYFGHIDIKIVNAEELYFDYEHVD